MRALLWLLMLAALAVGLALAARFNDGYVLIVLHPWRVDLSLNLLLLLQVLGFIAVYLFLRGVVHTLGLPQQVRAYRARRRREQAEKALGAAVRYHYEGRYGHALKSATTAYESGYAPGLTALMAARAASALRDERQTTEWLQRAQAQEGENRNARLMTEARVHLEAHRYSAAQTVLDLLDATGQRHIAALRYSLRAQQALGNWHRVLRLVKQLEKYRGLTAAQAAPLRLRAHQENLHATQQSAEALNAYWRSISVADRCAGSLAADAARRLIAAGDCRSAQEIIEDALTNEWDSGLLALYADCQQGDVLGRIARAEEWLKQQPRDAYLLLTLGHLCRQQQLWGKAQSYFEASLALQESSAAHIALAQLCDALQREDEANRHYRAAAMCTK